MTLQDIITLTNAGFTRNDIMALSGLQQPIVQQPVQQPIVQQPVQQPVQPVQPVQQPVQQANNLMQTDPMVTILQQLAGRTATMDIPPVRTAQDVADERYRNLMNIPDPAQNRGETLPAQNNVNPI